MNVPVLVLKGYNYNSRCGESIIKNSNNNFLIAEDIDDYISKAILLSKDLDKLNSIRQDLFDNILLSDLFNTKKYSENFNNLLLDIHRDQKKNIN